MSAGLNSSSTSSVANHCILPIFCAHTYSLKIYLVLTALAKVLVKVLFDFFLFCLSCNKGGCHLLSCLTLRFTVSQCAKMWIFRGSGKRFHSSRHNKYACQIQKQLVFLCNVEGPLFVLFSVWTLLMTFYYCWHLYVPLSVACTMWGRMNLTNWRFVLFVCFNNDLSFCKGAC